MKKRFLIITAIIVVNALAFTLTCPPKVFAEGGGGSVYRFTPELCPCDGEESNPHWDCHTATCEENGISYVCEDGWPDMECGPKIPVEPVIYPN